MTEPLTIDEIEARITGAVPIGRQPKDAGLWARHPDDWYIEPEWTSRRLFETERFEGTIVDPACGSGRIVRVARSLGRTALGYDKVSRCIECAAEEDFLTTDYETDNIVSNPPFGLCKKPDFGFVEQALHTAERKTALLLPLPWMTGADKGRYLQGTPLKSVYVLTPRPSMPPGPVIMAGQEPGGGTEDFAWFVWERGYTGAPSLRWLNRDDEA